MENCSPSLRCCVCTFRQNLLVSRRKHVLPSFREVPHMNWPLLGLMRPSARVWEEHREGQWHFSNGNSSRHYLLNFVSRVSWMRKWLLVLIRKLWVRKLKWFTPGNTIKSLVETSLWGVGKGLRECVHASVPLGAFFFFLMVISHFNHLIATLEGCFLVQQDEAASISLACVVRAAVWYMVSLPIRHVPFDRHERISERSLTPSSFLNVIKNTD